MPEVVLFRLADGAVRQEDVRALAGQSAHRMIGVNPRVHPFAGGEFGARWAQLRGHHRGAGSERREQVGYGAHCGRVLVRPVGRVE